MRSSLSRRVLATTIILFIVAVVAIYFGLLEYATDSLRSASLPAPELDSILATLRTRFVLTCLLLMALWISLGLWLLNALARRARRLRATVGRLLSEGMIGEPAPVPDELDALADSLRDAAPRIRELVDRLKLESARREAILASMVEGVLAVDRTLRVTFCNDSFARAVGAQIPVPEGTLLLQLVREPALMEILTKVLESGARVERRLALTNANLAFEVLAAPLAGGGARGGAIAILHDITALERLERIRKDFVANVSHELRTPLAAIRGYAETLLDGALDDSAHNRNFVEIILSQANRLNNIASDLLVLSELESGRTLQPKCISLDVALESALRSVESGAKVRNVHLVCGHIDNLRVMGHETRLEQALVNLLDNAVKFNRPEGEVRVETGRDNDRVRVDIFDNGIGIPSEDLPRIFERFYRVDKARSREVGGTGLGLSIVKHVVEQMGGSIKVESEVGKGSRFTLLLPSC